MLKKIPNCTLAAAMMAILSVSLSAAPDGGANPDVSAQIDSVFSPLAGSNSPGVAVLVIKNSHKIYQRGFGVRELRTKSRIDEHTNFRLASCSKQFTAMSIMLLVHDGKLRYDQKITEIFPDFPAYGNSITIRNLLNHTSGLPDYEDLMDQANVQAAARNPSSNTQKKWSDKNQIQDVEVLALLKQTSTPLFPPGTKWAYSNSGYVLLGLIVARISGQPFADFLHQRIFAPLKMDHTVAYVKGKNEVSNRAYGHTQAPAGFAETDQSSTSATLGDGGIYSSLEDLAKWDEALRTRKLLSNDEMQPALTPATLPDHTQPRWPANSDRPEGTPVSYGFGWFLDPYKTHPRTWHYGESIGFHTYIVRFASNQRAADADAAKNPLAATTIIILCNRTDLNPEALALQLADLLLLRYSDPRLKSR